MPGTIPSSPARSMTSDSRAPGKNGETTVKFTGCRIAFGRAHAAEARNDRMPRAARGDPGGRLRRRPAPGRKMQAFEHDACLPIEGQRPSAQAI